MSDVDRRTADALRDLAAFLGEVNYAALYDLCASGALFPADRRAARRTSEGLDGDARGALALFALDLALPRAELGPRLGTVVDGLQACGLAEEGPQGIRLDDLVVAPVLGGHLLTATPPGWRPAGGRSGRAYLGADSLRLARALGNTAGHAVLDVGTGCGVQGLLATRDARRVVLTDLEERSLALARLNAVLNGRESVEIRAGDAYAPVVGERFDLIACLPPYLPAIGATGEAVATGPDGLGLLRTLLAGARAHLAPGGQFVAFAQLLCDEDGPLLAREIPDLSRAGLAVEVATADWHPLHPYAAELAARLVAMGTLAVSDPRVAVLRTLRGLGATGVCTAVVRARAATLAEVPVRGRAGRVARAGRSVHAVPEPVPGVRVTHDASLRVLVGPTGTTEVVPGPTAALFAALDGGRSVVQAAARAWGTPDGADPQDLADEALERVLSLERAGFVRLPG